MTPDHQLYFALAALVAIAGVLFAAAVAAENRWWM